MHLARVCKYIHTRFIYVYQETLERNEVRRINSMRRLLIANIYLCTTGTIIKEYQLLEHVFCIDRLV